MIIVSFIFTVLLEKVESLGMKPKFPEKFPEQISIKKTSY